MGRILITGCGGMLGKAVYKTLADKFDLKATDIDVNEKWLSNLDVRDYNSVKKETLSFNPDCVLHLAALTDLEYCETNPEEAYKTNTMGTENVAMIAKKLDILMVYISTAGIFDGKKEIYDDYDEANPLSHYGRSKYMGEVFVKSHLDKYFVCRAGWMMGDKKKDKKFVPKILNQIKEGKKEISAVTDLFGSPTYTYDFANNLAELIKTNYYGVYNMVCNGEKASRYDVTKEMFDILELTGKIELKKVDSSFFKESFFAPRPGSEALINRKLTLRNLNKMRDWKVCLREYLENEWSQDL